MGLSSSMWTSVSGLLAHGEKMNVVGNNIANVSTVGFKAQRMDFEDFIYQTDFSASGPTQIGLGVGINAIMGDFSQGAFESTNSATDLAIGGNGFFEVRDQYTDEVWYTRAGNFNFDKDGFLRLPSGETLQGWKIDNSVSPTLATGAAPVQAVQSSVQGTGVPTDIKLDSWNVPPRQTTRVEFSVNLGTDAGYDKTPSTTNPFFAMSDAWNGIQPPPTNNAPPISSDAYGYQTSMKVYDEAGNSHTLTTYFDLISNPTVSDGGIPPIEDSLIGNLPEGYQMYEYMVTMDPTEDMRTYGGTYDPTTGVLTGGTSFQDTENAGVLMKGVLIFNSGGELINQTAYTYMGNTEFTPGQTIEPDGVDIDIDAYMNLATAADRAAYIDALPISDELKLQLNTELPTAIAAAEQQAIDLATNAANTAANAAGRQAGEAAVDAQSAYITTEAEARATTEAQAAADTAALAAANASGFAPGTAEYNDVFNTTYVATRDATYAAILPARQREVYDEVYNAAFTPAHTATFTTEYNLVFNELSESLPREAVQTVQDEINSDMVGHPDSNESWQPTAVSNNGLPVFTANFSGHPLANAVRQDAGNFAVPDASNYLIEFDLGLKAIGDLDDPWGIGAPVTYGSGAISPSIDDVINNNAIIAGHPGSIDYSQLVTFTPNSTEKASDATIMVDGKPITNSSLQDGYTFGSLSNINIDQDGILYGYYTNGITMPLYQITMYDFVNPQGLNREGGNLYSATRDSGNPQVSVANQGGMGEVVAYNLEMSNVDMAREFVQMISTQRGFQANSKGITTVDEMLNTVIGMKR